MRWANFSPTLINFDPDHHHDDDDDDDDDDDHDKNYNIGIHT